MPVTLTLPAPPVRETGTLISLARPLGSELFDNTMQENNWPVDGVTFQPWSYGAPTADEANCLATYLKDADDGLPTWVDQPAFLLWRSLQCSSLSGYLNELNRRINFSIDSLISYSLAAELETGTASGGLGLKGNVTYAPTIVEATAVSLRAAMLSLEDHLAAELHGAIGMIHLTAGLYALAVADDLVDANSRTGTGHLVVGDAGHLGQVAPQGSTVAGTDNAWIYATSQVYYGLTPVESSQAGVDAETFDFGRNVNRPLQERHGILVFDPNVTGAARVGEVLSADGI